MIYIAAIQYYTAQTGSEMEVITGDSLEDINYGFEAIQREVNLTTEIEDVQKVFLTVIGDEGTIIRNEKVQSENYIRITDKADDS